MITKLDIQEKDGFLIMEDFPASLIRSRQVAVLLP